MAQRTTSSPKARPVGATILAILAVIPAILAVVQLLQALGIFPYVIGPIEYRSFSLWYALMWAAVAWVYFWLIRMLWRVEPAAWMFVVFITLWHLMLDFFVLIGSATISDVAASFVVNGLILVYCMLPGVRDAFDTQM